MTAHKDWGSNTRVGDSRSPGASSEIGTDALRSPGAPNNQRDVTARGFSKEPPITFGDYRDDLDIEVYKKVCAGYDHIVARCAQLLDEGEPQRARAVLIINPWPLDPVALAGLRSLEGLPND